MPLIPNGEGGNTQNQIASVWDIVGDYFENLGNTAASVPIIGPVFSLPFLNMAQLFYEAGDLTRTFSEWYNTAVEVVRMLATGEAWADILDLVFPEWRDLRGWVTGTVQNIIPDTAYRIMATVINKWWMPQFPELWQFGDFEAINLYWAVSDPGHYVWQELQGRLDDLRTALGFPDLDYLLGLIAERLGLEVDEDGNIIWPTLNPLGWLEDHIDDLIDWLLRFGERILLYLLEAPFPPPGS